jgi:hypothetical protein
MSYSKRKFKNEIMSTGTGATAFSFGIRHRFGFTHKYGYGTHPTDPDPQHWWLERLTANTCTCNNFCNIMGSIPHWNLRAAKKAVLEKSTVRTTFKKIRLTVNLGEFNKSTQTFW